MSAPDSGLRERIISIGGLIVVMAMVLLVLVLLFPRRELIEKLRDEPRNDLLSVSYLINLLDSEPGNTELRLLLAQRQFALEQPAQAEVVLAPLLEPHTPATLRRRALMLQLRILQQGVAAAAPGTELAVRRNALLHQMLNEQADDHWETEQLLAFARMAAALDDPLLARRFYSKIDLTPDVAGSAWFDEAVHNAIGTRNYEGASQLHIGAIDAATTPEQRRVHLLAALRILQSANRLDEALQLAQQHDAVIGGDGALLQYLVELALAANRPMLGQPYVRRMLQMSQLRPPHQPGLIERLADLLIPSAHAATAGTAPATRGAPAAPKAGAATDAPAGEPRLPFDDTPYRIGYQTFLAVRNLADAYRVASAAVRLAPTNLEWRERLAQVAEWHSLPQEALTQWRWLAERSRDPRVVDLALRGVLRLAPGLNDDEALLDGWQRVAHRRALSVAETLDVVALCERIGRPDEALKWLVQQDAKAPHVQLLEARVDLLDRLGDRAVTINALERLMQREGTTPARAVRLASLHAASGDAGRAYEVLAPLAERTSESETPYWTLLADLAWTLQLEPQAIHALQMRGRGAPLEGADTARLIELLREREPEQAARLAEVVWQRQQRPADLHLALELWWSRRDMGQLQRLFASITPAQEQALAGDSAFWQLRAQWQVARGNSAAALDDMRRALAAGAQQPELRSTLIFMLIDAGQHEELARVLAGYAAQARTDMRYAAAYAAGYTTLGQPHQALPFWQRQIPSRQDDPLWLAAYGDALQAAGLAEPALAVQRRALLGMRARLAAPATAAPPSDADALQLQLARLTLAHAPGDPSLAVLRHLLSQDRSPGGNPALDVAVRELVLGWTLSNEQFEQARLWLWRHYGRQLAAPAWTEMLLALHERDFEAVDRLLVRQPDGLTPDLRIEALATLGRQAPAQALRHSELALREDDSLHEAYVAQAWEGSRSLRFGLDRQHTWLRLNTPLDAGLQAVLDVSQTSRGDIDPTVLTGVPANDRTLRLTLRQRLDNSTSIDATLGGRNGYAALADAALAVAARLDASVALNGSLGLNQPATETRALAVAGAKHEARLSANIRVAPTLQARLDVQFTSYKLQTGPRLGSGQGFDWELGQGLRLASPDLALRVFGNYHRYRPSTTPLPADTARFHPGGLVPDATFFMPASYSLHGIGISSGLSHRDSYTRAWRPFVDLSLTQHSLRGAGLAGLLGAAGSVFGNDHLSVFVGGQRAGPDGKEREAGLSYALLF